MRIVSSSELPDTVRRGWPLSARTQVQFLADEPLVRLVDRIYQGATDDAAWPGIVTAVAEFVGTPVGHLFTPFDHATDGGLSIACGAKAARAPVDERDAWAQTEIGRRLFYEGSVVIDSDLAPAPNTPPSTFCSVTAAGCSARGLCSGVVFDQRSFAVLPTVYSAYRDREEPPFGESERQRMHLLLPHLSRALRVLYRLRDAEQKASASLAALDHLACGVFLVDAIGEVLHTSREAERILAQGDGLALRRETGRTRLRLVASDPGSQNALQAALDPDAIGSVHCTQAIEARRMSGKRSYLIHVASLSGASSFAAETPFASALILVNDPEARESLDPELLQQIYGVTPAEARLAKRLLAGDTLAAAAARYGISQPTARTQLRALFQKTGTHRQAELTRLLVSLASSRA